jgi:hypothetical protein
MWSPTSPSEKIRSPASYDLTLSIRFKFRSGPAAIQGRSRFHSAFLGFMVEAAMEEALWNGS